MASTFTDLGIELMATGENAGTWGTKTNANLNLIEQLTGGVLSLSIAGSGTTALSIADGALTGTAQHRVIEFTGALTGSRIITFPVLTENFYIIKNATTNAQTLQLKAASGSGATVTFSTTNKGYKLIYLDGVATNTGVFEAEIGDITGVTAGTNLTGGGTEGAVTINLADASTSTKGAASFSSDNFAASSGAITIKDSGVATAEIQNDAVTVAKMAANSVDSAQYVDGSIDTAHIANDQITNALMANSAIDTDQLASDAVTLAKMASGTDGNLITYDTSGNPAAVATGTSGQVLTSAGAGAVPTFQTISSGGMTLLSSTNLANITAATTYRISVNTSGQNIMYMSLGRIATNGTSSGVMPDFKFGFNNDTTGTNYMFYRINADNAENKGDLSYDDNLFFLNGSGFAGFTSNSAQGIYVYAPAATDRYKTMSFASFGVQSGGTEGLKILGGGQWRNNGAITEVTFVCTQNLNHGVIDIYGIK